MSTEYPTIHSPDPHVPSRSDMRQERSRSDAADEPTITSWSRFTGRTASVLAEAYAVTSSPTCQMTAGHELCQLTQYIKRASCFSSMTLLESKAPCGRLQLTGDSLYLAIPVVKNDLTGVDGLPIAIYRRHRGQIDAN